MKIGIAWLVAAYVLSQFYRAFLAVLAPALERDIGVGADALSTASGIWFLTFAVMQIPVGWALDHIGPRRTAAVLLALGGGGGAALFAAAQGAGAINLAMALIGVGCAPVLMASYVIFAREYRPALFGTLAGAMIGVGSFGNVAGSLPLAWAVEALGWRATMIGLAAATFLVAVALAFTVRDPARQDSHADGPRGSLLDLLKIPMLWPVFAMMAVNYAPAAGLRGLWSGPYLADMHGLDTGAIGQATLVMGGAMIIGAFVYGPLERLLRQRKWLIFGGNFAVLVCLLGFMFLPDITALQATLLLAGVGLFGATFPVLIGHARSYFPAHLTGRGVTLMNLFGIGGAGVMQFVTGRLFDARAAAPIAMQYHVVFSALAITMALGLIAYLFSRDTID